MNKVSHIRGASGAMRKVKPHAPMTPAERDEHYAARTIDRCTSVGRACQNPKSCVIDTYTAPHNRALRFFARLAGWLRGKRS